MPLNTAHLCLHVAIDRGDVAAYSVRTMSKEHSHSHERVLEHGTHRAPHSAHEHGTHHTHHAAHEHGTHHAHHAAHAHDHEHDHAHKHPRGLRGAFTRLFAPHGHDAA